MYAIAMCVFQCTHAVVSKVNVYRCGKMVTTHMFTYCKHGYIGCFRWICCLDSREAKRVCVVVCAGVHGVPRTSGEGPAATGAAGGRRDPQNTRTDRGIQPLRGASREFACVRVMAALWRPSPSLSPPMQAFVEITTLEDVLSLYIVEDTR